MNLLNKTDKSRIIEAIRAAELRTSGEIRVHVMPRCGKDALKEAKKVFKRLKMHKTAQRNGVLIFVAPRSKRFAIVGDEGIHRHVGDLFWDRTRDVMTAHFSKEQLVEGIIAGIENAGKRLAEHFPRSPEDRNELPDRITQR